MEGKVKLMAVALVPLLLIGITGNASAARKMSKEEYKKLERTKDPLFKLERFVGGIANQFTVLLSTSWWNMEENQFDISPTSASGGETIDVRVEVGATGNNLCENGELDVFDSTRSQTICSADKSNMCSGDTISCSGTVTMPDSDLKVSYLGCGETSCPAYNEKTVSYENPCDYSPECTDDRRVICVSDNAWEIQTRYTLCGGSCSSWSTTRHVECGSDQFCQGGECKDKCDPQYEKRCYNGDVYWYDSCGNRGSLYDDCGSKEMCRDGKCTTETGGVSIGVRIIDIILSIVKI